MDYKCNVCGNVFDDALGTCPACGSTVLTTQPVVEAPVVEQPVQEPVVEQQAQPTYQYADPNAQNYQQAPYQQPQYQQQPYVINTDPQAKSKLAAGLLGIFLGCLGVHNFYLGYTGKAIAQLLISVLSCFTLSWGSAIWGLIEGILILTGSMNTDATGRPLKD